MSLADYTGRLSVKLGANDRPQRMGWETSIIYCSPCPYTFDAEPPEPYQIRIPSGHVVGIRGLYLNFWGFYVVSTRLVGLARKAKNLLLLCILDLRPPRVNLVSLGLLWRFLNVPI